MSIVQLCTTEESPVCQRSESVLAGRQRKAERTHGPASHKRSSRIALEIHAACAGEVDVCRLNCLLAAHASPLPEESNMRSAIMKRSIVIAGHKTSVSLEDEFWNGLKEIARDRRTTLSNIVGGLDTQRRHGNLSSAIRLFVLDRYRARTAAPAPDHALAADHAKFDAMSPSIAPTVHQSR